MAGALATGLALAQTSAGQATAPPAGQTQTQTQNQNPARRARQMRRNFHQRLMQELALSPAQKQQAKEIFQQTRSANQPVRAQLVQNRESLAAAIKSDDTAQIRKLTEARASLMAKMMTARSEAMAKFYAQLTPEQKAKADQIHQRLQQRRAQWRTRTNG